MCFSFLEQPVQEATATHTLERKSRIASKSVDTVGRSPPTLGLTQELYFLVTGYQALAARQHSLGWVPDPRRPTPASVVLPL